MENKKVLRSLRDLLKIYENRNAEALANNHNEVAKFYNEKIVEVEGLIKELDTPVEPVVIAVVGKDRAEFEALAQTVADRVGVDLDFYDSANDGLNTGEELRIVDDDGAFNIAKFGVRACFYIGQDVSLAKYNRVRREILKGMNISGVEDER